jgi:hypothetical protein
MSQVVAEAVFRILQIGELVSDLLVCCHQSYFLKGPDLSSETSSPICSIRKTASATTCDIYISQIKKKVKKG